MLNSTLGMVDANHIYITMPSGRTITIDEDPRNSILPLKDALQDLEGIPAAQRKLFFAGKPLAKERSLLDYRVPKFSYIIVVKENLRKAIWASCRLASWNESSKHCIKVYPRDLKEVIARRTAENAKKDVKDTKTSAIASTVSARDYGPIEAILMGDGCTGTGVSMVSSPTSASIVANVPRRRDRSVGPINNVKGRGVMTAEIEHFVHIISVFVVLLRIFFFIIGYVMGANAIHLTIANVPEDLLLIGLTLTAKHLETVGCTSCIYSEMGTLTQHNFMNGTATSICTSVLLCV
jgi:hypothetical protein